MNSLCDFQMVQILAYLMQVGLSVVLPNMKAIELASDFQPRRVITVMNNNQTLHSLRFVIGIRILVQNQGLAFELSASKVGRITATICVFPYSEVGIYLRLSIKCNLKRQIMHCTVTLATNTHQNCV